MFEYEQKEQKRKTNMIVSVFFILQKTNIFTLDLR